MSYRLTHRVSYQMSYRFGSVTDRMPHQTRWIREAAELARAVQKASDHEQFGCGWAEEGLDERQQNLAGRFEVRTIAPTIYKKTGRGHNLSTAGLFLS